MAGDGSTPLSDSGNELLEAEEIHIRFREAEVDKTAILRLVAAYDREVAHSEIYEDLKNE